VRAVPGSSVWRVLLGVLSAVHSNPSPGSRSAVEADASGVTGMLQIDAV
jgi:hypothetical protein